MNLPRCKLLSLLTAAMIASGMQGMDAASKPEIIGLQGTSNRYISENETKIIGKNTNQIISLNNINKIIILENNTQDTDELQLKNLFYSIEKGPTIKPLWKKELSGEISSPWPMGKNVTFAVVLIIDDQNYFKMQVFEYYIRITTQSEIGIFPSAY